MIFREPFGVLDDQFDDVVLVDRFKGIVAGVGDLLKQIVEILFLHGVMNHEVTHKFDKPVRVVFRLLIKLSEFLVVTDQCIDDVHAFSFCPIGCLLTGGWADAFRHCG